MRLTVFYSWQADLSNRTNRGLIGDALGKAISAVASEVEITRDERPDNADSAEFLLDRDTSGVPGAPDIAHTIFDKISNANIFVGDVSIINSDLKPANLDEVNYRPTPNPNVLIELGYAARHLTWDCIICVFNVAYGAITDLPFDIRNRRILDYKLSKGQSGTPEQRDRLAGELRTAIQAIAARIRSKKEEAILGPLERMLSELEHNAYVATQQDGPAAAIPFRLEELSKLSAAPVFSQLPASLQSQLRQVYTSGQNTNAIIDGRAGGYSNRSDALRAAAGEKARSTAQIQSASDELKKYLRAAKQAH
jgi:hypothetical protein